MKSVFALLLLSAWCAAQDGVPVHMLVTVEGEHNRPAPEITQQDVMVFQGKERLNVTSLTPLRGNAGALQLAILIDDAASSELGVQFGDIKNFISSLPSNTEVALEYMRNGTVQVAQQFTTDHAAAAKNLRLPLGPFGGANASPYFSLQEAIKRWPGGSARREVLMISSGIDPYYPVGPENPYLASAISDAQKAGIVVHSIYYHSGGHLGHSFGPNTWGQSYLSMLGDQTGGEAYWQGPLNAVSFEPYFKDLSMRLQHQYLVSFLERPGNKAEFRSVKLRTEMKGAELVSADRVWVPAGR